MAAIAMLAVAAACVSPPNMAGQPGPGEDPAFLREKGIDREVWIVATAPPQPARAVRLLR